jgi:O-acetyl-ADP-ribose deacetylase (regulator of RNase III)
MIRYKTGDLFQDNSQAIVNTVNCVGVMGRGIALQFKKSYPDNFKAYKDACSEGNVKPGKMFVYKTGALTGPEYIINFPTKRHWRGKSKIEDIESGLKNLNTIINQLNITSIAVPPLGAGLGGLNWADVKSLIESNLSELSNVDITLYKPKGAPAPSRIAKNKNIPNMTPGRAALISLMNEYLKGLLDPFISLLEIHKLMFFLQESGEVLKLNFKKAQYGPYAENMRHVLNHIEGYYLSGYADGGDSPSKTVQLIPGAYEEASEFITSQKDTLSRLNKVIDLVEGFESPYGLELLSSVYWVKKYNKAETNEDVLSYIYNWNKGKHKFTSRQIDIALTVLAQKGWIEG